jgi:PKD repeat protein
MKKFSSLLGLALLPLGASADCTLTTIGKSPLPEMGFQLYGGFPSELYPNYANQRPPSHLSAGIQIANGIVPLNANGTPDPANGKIVMISVGMSNTTQEFDIGSNDSHDRTKAFKYRADSDLAKNPQLIIVDGAQGGQDATRWLNVNDPTWATVRNRLTQTGVTPNQVQIAWVKQSLANPLKYGSFPSYVELLETDLAIIARNLKTLFPNLQLAYVSNRTRAYTNAVNALNPEPASWELGFATKWLIENQINGAADLNFDPSKGSVVAPWLSWGPYLWVDGTTPRSDGLTWLCSDLVTDFTHPSSSGVYKVATQLLTFFKTDPTTVPWFLKHTFSSIRPTCAPSADISGGPMPLTVHFSANASDPDGTIVEYVWTFDDGTFSTSANPAKIFKTPGVYSGRLTVTDNNGDWATNAVSVTVNSSLTMWKSQKFTSAELADPTISGDAADPDGDGVPNLIEYAMGYEPKTRNALPPKIAAANEVATVEVQHYKPATDAEMEVETSTDLSNWSAMKPSSRTDHGTVETLIFQNTISLGASKFFRVRATHSPGN